MSAVNNNDVVTNETALATSSAQHTQPSTATAQHTQPATATEEDSKLSVIIFDWDDTLMASSWVDQAKLLQTDSFSALPGHLQVLFTKLEEAAAKCLCEASARGAVVIITNAEAGWVEYAARRFMPRLVPVLEGTRVVSARSTYEKFYPNAPLCWKAAAFAHEANQIFGAHSGPREIISFGDSNEERTAVRIAAGQLGAVPKSVKFVDLPSPEQLVRQVETVTSWLSWVQANEGEMDLMLKTKFLDQAAGSPAVEFSEGTNNCGAVPSSSLTADAPWRPPPMAALEAKA